jgi:hypothetical protein
MFGNILRAVHSSIMSHISRECCNIFHGLSQPTDTSGRQIILIEQRGRQKNVEKEDRPNLEEITAKLERREDLEFELFNNS